MVDPDPGSGASHFAAGMIAPVSEAEFGEDAVIAVNRDSAERYPAFIADVEADSGLPAGYQRCGSLHVALDADEHAALERLSSTAEPRAARCPPHARETRELEPGLAPSVRSGMLVEGDHQVDPRALVAALLAACAELGVEVHRGRGALTSTGAG